MIDVGDPRSALNDFIAAYPRVYNNSASKRLERIIEDLKAYIEDHPITEELFFQIEGWPDYAVSSYGRVINVRTGKDLKGSRVTLYERGFRTTKGVNQIVAQAFFVDWVPGLEVRHISDDLTDNSVGNLTLGEYVWD